MNTDVLPIAARAKKNWTLDDVSWGSLDRNLVDPEVLKIIKAAALVEYNAHDYARYLGNVFKDDEAFRQAIVLWAEEEVRHGAALGRWAEMVDPTFNFKESFDRFTSGYRINVDAQESIRGSRAGELMARCIVETGTSNYYMALAESTNEPVLKTICEFIAGDELRHYKLFYAYMRRYLEKEKLSSFQRLRIGIGRIAESEDDELAYAYYAANVSGYPSMAANDNAMKAYDRGLCCNAYAARAFGFYRTNHVRKMVTMVFKACGLDTQGWFAKTVSLVAWLGLRSRYARAKRVVAKKVA